MLRLLAGAFFGLCAGLCFAQVKTPIVIAHSGSDSVGTQFVYFLKERIRASKGMELITEVSVVRPQIRVEVITLDNAANMGAIIGSTIVFDSVDIPIEGALLTSYLQNCGRDRVSNCVDSLLGQIDQQADRLRTKYPRYWLTLITGKADSATAQANQPNSPASIPSTTNSVPSAPRQKPRVPENPF